MIIDGCIGCQRKERKKKKKEYVMLMGLDEENWDLIEEEKMEEEKKAIKDNVCWCNKVISLGFVLS